jgi:hypothetical protein
MQRDAASQFAFEFGEKQSSARRRVIARQRGKFVIEILEAKTETERLCIFEEKFAGLRDLLW